LIKSKLNILVITDDFPPNWAPRIGYFVKYLSQSGHKIYVVSGVRNKKEVYTSLQGYAENVDFFERKKRNKLTRVIDVVETFLPTRNSHREKEIFLRAGQIIKERKIELILCSISDIFPGYTAYKLAKLYRIPMHIDFRDIYEQLGNLLKITDRNFRMWPYHIRDKINLIGYKYYRKKILSISRSCTTVSDFHAGVLRKNNSNVSVIYNGYDHEKFFTGKKVFSKKFYITYAGTVYNTSISDHRIFIRAIKKLAQNGLIDSDIFSVRFFSGNIRDSNIINDIDEAGLSKFFEFHEWVDSDHLPALYAESSILLLLSASNKVKNGPRGIIFTKFFEYLGANRRILCVPSDEADVERLIDICSAGKSLTEVNEIMNFIEQAYKLWKKDGYVSGMTKIPEKIALTREQQARTLESIICSSS